MLQVLICSVTAISTVVLIKNIRKERKIKTALARYEMALDKGHVNDAYEAGKQYYAALNGGKLTEKEMRAILQDLKVIIAKKAIRQVAYSAKDIAQ